MGFLERTEEVRQGVASDQAAVGEQRDHDQGSVPVGIRPEIV